MQATKIKEFEVIDHGIDHAQYFQGCGIAYTKFDRVATGCGENATEAFEDALEQIAMDGFDVQPIEESADGKLFTSIEAQKASVEAYLDKQQVPEEDREDCELYYYVSIRWS